MRDPRPRVARVTRPERALGQGARCARKASWYFSSINDIQFDIVYLQYIILFSTRALSIMYSSIIN